MRLLEPLAAPVAAADTRQLSFKAWKSSGKDLIVYQGREAEKGTAGKGQPKTMYFRDLFCLLPFQLNRKDFAVAVYIQTRNILEDYEDCGTYRIQFPELTFPEYSATVWDPFRGAAHPHQRLSKKGEPLAVSLVVPDTPVWMLVTAGREVSPILETWGTD